MTIRTTPWPPNVPCWADLSTPDVDAARAFYAAVIGWEFQDTDEEYGGYTIAAVGDAAAAGVGPAQPGAPTAWTLYVASDDADKTAEAVAENGGTVIVPPGDVGPLGRMFIAADPTGAAFGVWQAGTHIGAGIANEPGGMTWEDLRTTDADAAREFYEAVFGYAYQAIDGAPEDYTTFHLPGDEAPLGGMGGMFGAEDSPPHWLVYFAVASAEAAVAAAEQGGGTVISPLFETPYGRMAGIADPAGAVFFVNENTGQPQPDR
jgi:predicted enzyme related to lactoylglutathione lyase